MECVRNALVTTLSLLPSWLVPGKWSVNVLWRLMERD